MAEYRVRGWPELQAACFVAEPGDVILIHGGRYDRPTKLVERRDITIRAADDEWIHGGQSPEAKLDSALAYGTVPAKPSAEDYAFLQIDDCERIVIEGFKVRHCWPAIFFIKDSRHVTIRNCALRGGTYAIFAKGKEKPCSHLLIEYNEWRQDDSPEHLLWTELDWARAHGGEGEDGRYSYFNGGFLSTKGIRGNVVVRRNRIMDAYNGIRMKFGDKVPSDKQGGFDAANANVHIVDNDFIRIRDNPTEPEGAAWNWHVRHNRLVDCHSWFSFDGVAGGFWYYYGNTGRFTSRQGLYGTVGHTMGRVLKLSYQKEPRDDPPNAPASERVPKKRWYVFNNSWHLRCPLIGGANAKVPKPPKTGEGPDFTANLAFFNNAFQWCDATRHGPWVCENIELMRNFDFARSAETSFDFSITDRADYVRQVRKHGHEANGIAAPAPIFEDADGGRFRLVAGMQAKGLQPALKSPNGSGHLKVQGDKSVNRGAVQDYGLAEVNEFRGEYDRLLAELKTPR